jgi:hypothetical protein
MVGRARENLPQSPTLSRGNLRLVGGDVSLRSLIPPVSLIGNTSAMFRGTAKIFTELLQHPSGNNGSPKCRTRKKDRLVAVFPKPNRMFGSDGCALGVFDLEAASDSIEHGHLSLLDRCDGIVDGERSVFVQQLGIIRSAFNARIVLPLGYPTFEDFAPTRASKSWGSRRRS